MSKIKGVILAGGLGKRLDPLTKVTNKHLLPIYNKPMIYYPIETLAQAGIKDILLVTGGNSAGDFLRLLGDGQELGVNLSYNYQRGEGGIAQALSLAANFANNQCKVVVILGDNIVEKSIKKYVDNFRKQREGARLLLKEVEDPQRFGVAEIKNNKLIKIEEKPKKPKSNYIVTGIYMYNHQVFAFVQTIKPSKRGELEITDVNNIYIKKGLMEFDILDGWWSDSGTFTSLLRANNLVAKACHVPYGSIACAETNIH